VISAVAHVFVDRQPPVGSIHEWSFRVSTTVDVVHIHGQHPADAKLLSCILQHLGVMCRCGVSIAVLPLYWALLLLLLLLLLMLLL